MKILTIILLCIGLSGCGGIVYSKSALHKTGDVATVCSMKSVQTTYNILQQKIKECYPRKELRTASGYGGAPYSYYYENIVLSNSAQRTILLGRPYGEKKTYQAHFRVVGAKGKCKSKVIITASNSFIKAGQKEATQKWLNGESLCE